MLIVLRALEPIKTPRKGAKSAGVPEPTCAEAGKGGEGDEARSAEGACNTSPAGSRDERGAGSDGAYLGRARGAAARDAHVCLSTRRAGHVTGQFAPRTRGDTCGRRGRGREILPCSKNIDELKIFVEVVSGSVYPRR